MTNVSNYPTDETDLTSGQMDQIMVSGGDVELVAPPLRVFTGEANGVGGSVRAWGVSPQQSHGDDDVKVKQTA